MKINKNNVKFYLPIYLLVGGLSILSPRFTSFAEGEEEILAVVEDEETVEQSEVAVSSESAEVASTSIETTAAVEQTEEVLYEETSDDYELETIVDENSKTDEQKKEEAEIEAQKQAQALADAIAAEKKKEEIEAQKQKEEAIIGSTEIDEADEIYNTGRGEIPNTVKTEAERKELDELPPDKETPANPSNPQTPSSSSNNSNSNDTTTSQKPEEPEEPTPPGLPIPTPKMGIADNGILVGTAAAGIVLASIGLLKDKIEMFRVIKSRGKYVPYSKRKKDKTKKLKK